MKILGNENGGLEISELQNGIKLNFPDGKFITIYETEGGFEVIGRNDILIDKTTKSGVLK